MHAECAMGCVRKGWKTIVLNDKKKRDNVMTKVDLSHTESLWESCLVHVLHACMGPIYIMVLFQSSGYRAIHAVHVPEPSDYLIESQ